MKFNFVEHKAIYVCPKYFTSTLLFLAVDMKIPNMHLTQLTLLNMNALASSMQIQLLLFLILNYFASTERTAPIGLHPGI